MTSSGIEAVRPPLRFARATDGRVLGGVCAGLPSVWGLGVTRLRAVFVLAGLCGGLGAVVYLACWLIMPVAETEPDVTTPPVVWVAGTAGALAVVVLLAGLSAMATVFGLGWVMFAIAAVVLIAALGPLARRVPASLAVLAVAVLAVPSLIVALTPLRVDLQDGPTLSAPHTAAQVGANPYQSGFGTSFIDLRRTKLPRTGTITMRIDAGVRRTIVALPTDACVRVHVTYAIHPFAAQLTSLLAGNPVPPSHAITLFGSVFGAESNQLSGTASHGTHGSGPTLDIDFSSQGGGLFVRDYPDDVSPRQRPNWPGYTGTPEPPPDLVMEPKRLRPRILREWKQRRAADLANERTINSLMGGPCAS